ncbi:NADH-quinone oxidoreductase subunit D [Dermatophilus congolensis]|uniref:NADH-quinone oxidoreductase subunit D n=1 Tax=Dermatophilus congolensis TaxID=1863 RepID=A0AA46BNP3_9MICO|nr:NADH-quinone oxidoreductase subunit D [Dermatophilus congolensis]MBO3152228.1 NADH-quinone oxidoreductase subunit D [Dermatophilus congolensis]MBO3160759.1 NADH-quinone oxidoreductase subunit D [Dermatophilus congolensis]MBO3163519.1 NADH-quinone oxidoreductase subunit D [Dermatophilus congolensis]MBO3177065.1 NADH-quinone oxidoreductase subunit D [Dermatophilus congolensis]
MTTNTSENADVMHGDVRASGAASDNADGYLINAVGGDWDQLTQEAMEHSDERIVVNMGPQHPSTHGVLRLILELDGETVTEARVGIGYLHTGIEKTMEFRTWTQGVTLCTRMDYLTPLFQETTYCLGTERLLGIEDQITTRASDIRVMMMELTRISSHFVAVATGGLELGATTVMEIGFRGREACLRVIEAITGLRMNNGYIRPGGVAQDLPSNWQALLERELPELIRAEKELEDLTLENPILKGRYENVGVLDLAGCMALGVTGPILRSAGYPLDLRRADPYCGYENYDFDICVWDTADAYGRLRVRLNEIKESIKILRQCIDRLRATEGQPVMIADKKIAWPAQLSVGTDGQGNSLEHIREIMGESMESLIHHFKIVTEGFRVPAGQAYRPVESPKGELGAYLASDGGTRPYRAHFRDPAFHNLQAAAVMIEGGYLADAVVALASIDPVLGGVDR